MVDLEKSFGKLRPSRILVAGDLMLDAYTVGEVGRISPEAPVPVLLVKERSSRPGGSGNVVLNLVSMGAKVRVLGRIGKDEAGAVLQAELAEEGAELFGLIEQAGYVTPVKNRVIASGQQIVRIDEEEQSALPELLEQQLADSIPALLQDIELVALSDYGKGYLTPTLTRALIVAANERDIPVLVDPKGLDFSRYCGCTILKPNLPEVYMAAGLERTAPLEKAAASVLVQAQAEILMVTRSEKGISLFYREGKREDFPVTVREVRDVTGAGDTVLATLAVALASGLSPADAARLSNLAAGAAIERFGCARISLTDLSAYFFNLTSRSKKSCKA